MASFSVATVDGKEINVELDLDLGSLSAGEWLKDVIKPGGWLMAREIIDGPDRDAKRTDILIFGSAIVAIRQA